MADSHEQPTDQFYIKVAVALGVLTVISYICDKLSLNPKLLVVLVLGVSVVKATLVCMFFMHLKFDWGKVKVMVISAGILSLVLVFALLPDICLSDRHDPMNDPNLNAVTSIDHSAETPESSTTQE